MTMIAVSGGFDPLHIGHVRMIQAAAQMGNVLVIVNNDHWLRTKKGFVFMPEAERLEIVGAIQGVALAVLTEHAPDDPDRSVCRMLRRYRPNVFCNGGDRGVTNTPEIALCRELAIDMHWAVGGAKVQSSSALVAHVPKIA